MINAPVEGLTQSRVWGPLIGKRRVAVPMAGRFEWTTQPDPAGGRKPIKVPYYLHPAEGERSLLAAAGLYAWWRDPDRAENDPDRWLASLALVTRDSVAQDVAAIHTRSPLFLEPAAIDAWLDPGLVEGEHARGLLLDQRQPDLEIREVDRAVNGRDATGPRLIESVAGHHDDPLTLLAT